MNTPTGHTLEILHDDSASSPRENDNLGTFAGWHRRYRLGDVQPQEDPRTYQAALPKGSLIVPVYMYDHSGVALSTSDFGDRWDSGQVGIYHMSPQDIINAYGKDTPETRARAVEGIKGEIAEYSDYLNGNCWGFEIQDADGNQVEACWGFIGTDVVECGMAENIPVDYFPLIQAAADKVGLGCDMAKLQELEAGIRAHQARQARGPKG